MSTLLWFHSTSSSQEPFIIIFSIPCIWTFFFFNIVSFPSTYKNACLSLNLTLFQLQLLIFLLAIHGNACLESCWDVLISSSCHLPLIQSGFCLDHSTILAVTNWSRNSPSTNVNSGISIFIIFGLPAVWQCWLPAFLDHFSSGISFSFSLLTCTSQSHLQAYFFLHMDYVPQSCSSKHRDFFTVHSLWATTHLSMA